MKLIAKCLALYSPPLVLVLWAAFRVSGAQGTLLTVVGLLSLAAALAFHIREERERGRRTR